MNRARCSPAAAVLWCAFAPAANAAFIQVRDAAGGEDPSGEPGGYYLELTGHSIRATVGGESSRILNSGAFDFEIMTPDSSGWVPFITFCLQPRAPVGFDEFPADRAGLKYQEAPLSGSGFTPTEELQLEILWANAFDLATNPVSEDDFVLAGAFQAIVWELVEDDTFDLDAGSFDLTRIHGTTDDVFLQAQAWWQNIADGTWTDSVPLLALTDVGSQDFIRVVPQPGSLLLAGAAFLTALPRPTRRADSSAQSARSA